MPTALAISPHLDDAVFSAGGTLARLARGGWHVAVATVFAASVPNPQGFALACQLDKGLAPDVDYMALRRDEDAAACAMLGLESIWLPFEEAPHRGYASAPALFAGLRGDDDVVERVAPAIARLVDDRSPDLLFMPQCVGGHVDHVAVYAACENARPCRFWVDFPYWARQSSPQRPFSYELSVLSEEIIALNEDEVALKSRAIMAYASQLDFQFGGRVAVEAACQSDGVCERFAIRK